MAVTVHLAHVAVYGVDTGDADGHVGCGVAPGPAKGVRDDNRDHDAQAVLNRLADAPCRGVGVVRQQREGVVARYVGGVDAGVGAVETVLGLGDDYPTVHAHDTFGFPEHPFSMPRVPAVAFRDGDG